MSYAPLWITDETYVIRDDDYGIDLCKVEFRGDAGHYLSTPDKYQLLEVFCEQIVKALAVRIEESSDE